MSQEFSPELATLGANSVPHLHGVSDTCPLCEQPIPRERAQKIAERLQAREREQTAAITARLKAEAEELAVKARAEGTAAAEAAASERVASAEQAKADAEARAAAAEAQTRTLKETQEAQLAARFKEQTAALEAAKSEEVNALKLETYKEKLTLSSKIEELQRALDKKTAEQLGEGAERDLFEDLRAEFREDRIERVSRGLAGADIMHTVIHNGRVCGKIIYDSKNHGAWRNDFVSKLKSDQMKEKAEHAVLSTRAFPAEKHHLHVQDGVIIASPARVAALVTIIRQHLVQTHILRLSNEDRTQKTAALYSFITSDRCNDCLSRFDTHAEDLLELQAKEKKAHEANWKRQGELIRSVQNVRAELRNEIDSIIGTAAAGETGR